MLRAKAEAPQSVVEVSDDVIDIMLRYTLPESAKIILVCLSYISLQRNKTSKHGETRKGIIKCSSDEHTDVCFHICTINLIKMVILFISS